MSICVHMCEYVHTSVGIYKDQKESSHPLEELELLALVSSTNLHARNQTWVI